MNIPHLHTDPNEIVFISRDRVLSIFLALGKECGGLYVFLQLAFAPTEECVEHTSVGKSEYHHLRGVCSFSFSEQRLRFALSRLHDAEILCVESRYRNRPPISPWLRRAIFERDGRVCVLCKDTNSLELDHIKPYCDGGLSTEENLRVVCKKCNKARRRKKLGGTPSQSV